MATDDDEPGCADDRYQVELLTRATTPARIRELSQLQHLWLEIQLLMGPTVWTGLLLVLATPLAAQQRLAAMQRTYATTTVCQNGKAVTEPIWGFTAADSAEIAAHEAIHRRQLAPGCDSVHALWDRDFNVKMNAEAEALCGGMRAAGRDAKTRERRMVQQAMWWAQYRGGYSMAEYLSRFECWCQP